MTVVDYSEIPNDTWFVVDHAPTSPSRATLSLWRKTSRGDEMHVSSRGGVVTETSPDSGSWGAVRFYPVSEEQAGKLKLIAYHLNSPAKWNCHARREARVVKAAG